MPKLEKVMADDVTQTINVDFRMCKADLSLSAFGLAVHIQSFNTDPTKGRVWDFSVKGLMEILPNQEHSIRTALKELKEKGYITEKRLRDEKGRFVDSVYTFYQKPINPDCQNRNVGNRNVGNRNVGNRHVGNRHVGNLRVEKPNVANPREENQGQYKL